MADVIHPALLDQWFPTERQRYYIQELQKQRGLTRRRAECFIRLWAYLMLKQHERLPESPMLHLTPLEGAIPCTHREAAGLFYMDSDRGSDRAAGMMLDQLAQVGLLQKTFDGNTISVSIRTLPELVQLSPSDTVITYQIGPFNPRTDTVPVASFLANNYSWINLNRAAIAHKVTKLLRQWIQQYPTGMRVLRRCDTQQAVGFYVFYPTASTSEENFFLPPSLSIHISNIDIAADPIQIAFPGDPTCLSVFIRSWIIDTPYMSHASLCLFLRDAQATLIEMRKDFPNLCDLYALPIHPSHEMLAKTLGFQRTFQDPDPQSSVCWMHLAIDHFLEVDIETAVSRLPLSK
jgi:hypothetical protein